MEDGPFLTFFAKCFFVGEDGPWVGASVSYWYISSFFTCAIIQIYEKVLDYNIHHTSRILAEITWSSIFEGIWIA